ncbi:DUF7426 family protein [Intrasporangium flavum]|uniref:DUF7426 family protein n=1 Tax=Intrasporangium flavum TaxID=1428657 RepID=UPI00096D02CB|nr:hypothetical protein [Intrasporangium flavum]
MALKRFTPEPLIFPMPNGTDYEVPPVDIDRGWRLSQLMSKSQAELDAADETDEDLFRLVLSDELWDRMRTESVPIDAAWRAGMAALAHFRIVDQGQGPLADIHAAAMLAAEAIWESGIHPEAVAAWGAANLTTTSPATAEESAATASTSGTSSPTEPSPVPASAS